MRAVGCQQLKCALSLPGVLVFCEVVVRELLVSSLKVVGVVTVVVLVVISVVENSVSSEKRIVRGGSSCLKWWTFGGRAKKYAELSLHSLQQPSFRKD